MGFVISFIVATLSLMDVAPPRPPDTARIEKALDAQYIRNLDDIDVGFGFPFFFSLRPQPGAASER